MDEDREQEQGAREPKLLVVEIIFGHLIYGVADIISWAEVGVPVVELIITPLSIWYLRKRGLGGVNTVIRYLVAKVIPGVSLLPIFTIAWVAVWWIDQHPELEAKVEKVGELAQKVPSTPGAVAGEAEKETGAATAAGAQRGPALEEGPGRGMIDATGTPPSSGREITEQDFGIEKGLEKPMEATEEELLERPAVDVFAERRRREQAEEVPAGGTRPKEPVKPEEGEEPDWEMERRMNTGLAALHRPEEELSELPFSVEPDAKPGEQDEAGADEEGDETINLRKAA